MRQHQPPWPRHGAYAPAALASPPASTGTGSLTYTVARKLVETMKTKHLAVSAALITVLGITAGVTLWRRADAADRPRQAIPTFQAVDESVPEHQLLDDALYITAWRQSGLVRNNAVVPKNRPPNLTRIHLGSDGEAITDTYQFGEHGLQAIVAYSAKPNSLCENAEEGQVPALCVRDGAMTGTAGGSGDFRYLTVYFTGNVNGTPSTADPDTANAQRFWADTDFVPISEAAWFTDLVNRGRAAIEK